MTDTGGGAVAQQSDMGFCKLDKLEVLRLVGRRVNVSLRSLLVHVTATIFGVLVVAGPAQGLECHTCGKYKIYQYRLAEACDPTAIALPPLVKCQEFFGTVQPQCFRAMVNGEVVRGCTPDNDCPESRDGVEFRCCAANGCNAGPFDDDLFNVNESSGGGAYRPPPRAPLVAASACVLLVLRRPLP